MPTAPDAPAKNLTLEEAERLAGALLGAFETGEPIAPVTDAHPAMSVEDAYLVQRVLLAGHARLGRRVAGRKIGLTSVAIQRQLGVDTPDFGALLDSHVFPADASLSRAELRMVAPRIEPEVAFVLDRELRGPGVGPDDVRDCTRAVLPVFEIIDSRIRDWRITLADTVADNASCLGAVLGAEVPLERVGRLATLTVQLTRDGEILQEGEGTAVMGDPAAAVAWLANELARFDEALPAGQPVLSGSFTAAADAIPGHYTAHFGEALGSVGVDIVD